uniref:Uncharacterized protein n=1 Tax=Trypanosoma vivax (strain Y486) TaxID=1055687 RepID=G0U7C6_TRYVY|nr:hypothetical protein TVY486_1008300 [Trypanosoma vivax Y486]
MQRCVLEPTLDVVIRTSSLFTVSLSMYAAPGISLPLPLFFFLFIPSRMQLHTNYLFSSYRCFLSLPDASAPTVSQFYLSHFHQGCIGIRSCLFLFRIWE